MGGIEFYRVRQLIHYVDKTMLIKEVLNLGNPGCNIICGPRNWGKSTNISMLYQFFAIYQTTPSPVVDVKDNPYKVLFDSTQIAECPEIIENHFGRYPVIYLDLCIIRKSSHAQFKAHLAMVVNFIKGEYKYLLKDKNIRGELRRILTTEESEIERNPSGYLADLCDELKIYYSRPPIILIDDFDYPLTYMLEQSISRKEKEKIFKLFASFYKTLLKDRENMHMTILTGASILAIPGLFDPWLKYTQHRLVDGELIDFYGFQQEEMDQLLDNLEFVPKKDDTKQQFSNDYNGYRVSKFTLDANSKEKQEYVNLYNPNSVTYVLRMMHDIYNKYHKSTVEYDWEDYREISGKFSFCAFEITYLEKVFSALGFHLILKKLLRGVPIYSNLRFISSAHVSMSRVIDIYESTLSKPYVEEYYSAKDKEDMVLSILVANGHLAFEKAEINAQSTQISEHKSAVTKMGKEGVGNATSAPNERKLDETNTGVEGCIAQGDNNRGNHAFRVSIPNNELRRDYAVIEDSLMDNINGSHARCFGIAATEMRELLSVDRSTDIDSSLTQILECFYIFVARKKKIRGKNMAEAKEGITFDETTLQFYKEGIIPRGKGVRVGSDVEVGKDNPDLVLASIATNRVVVIELNIGKNKLDDAYAQAHRYAKEARDEFESAEEVLLVGINCDTYSSEPADVDLMKDRIEYKYSLHRYETTDKDENGVEIGNPISEGRGVVAYEETLKNRLDRINWLYD